MSFCNPLQEFNTLLCDVPAEWRNAISEALNCALSQILSANVNVDAHPSCDGVKDCESVTSFYTSITDNIVTVKYVDEKNITIIRNTDLTNAINNALDAVYPKCLMTQEEWDALTYQQRLSAIFNKVCCVHNNCTGSEGSGCGCDDCDEDDVECIGLTACTCVTYEVTGTAPFTFTYKDCETKEIIEFESAEDDTINICAIKGTVVTPLNVFCNQIASECEDIPVTTTSTSTTSTTTEETTTTTSTSTTTTTTEETTTTTTSTSTTTTTTGVTTTTSTTSTTTEPPLGIAIPSRYDANLGSVCSQPTNTTYTDDGTIVTGKIVYTDIFLTNPLIGYNYISSLFAGNIYEIDSLTATVAVNTGSVC